MTTTSLASRLSFWAETTSGTGPANAAVWAAQGTSVRHISGSLDPSSLVQSVIEDQRSQLYALDDEPIIHGIAGGGEVSFGWDAYAHGANDIPDDGETIAANAISTILLNALGGRDLGTTDLAVTSGDHTTTQVETTDTYAVGQWLGFDDSSGLVHLRRVTGSSAGGVGQIHTLHRALPFTPQEDSYVRGCIVITIDEDELEDSDARTLSWLIERGRLSQRQTWECFGCQTNLTQITLGRNDVPLFSFETLVSSFTRNTAIPTWANSIEGNAGRAIGPNTRVFYQAYGTTTEQTLQVSGFSVDPGVRSQPIMTQTEDATGMPGVAGYTIARNPGRVTFQAVPHANARLTEFQNSTALHLQFERLAPAGAAWSIYFPRITHDQDPSYASVNDALAQGIGLRCHQDGSQSTDLARSRIQLVMC